MKTFKQLFLDCHDARVFRDKSKHQILSQIFYKYRDVEEAKNRQKYFIIGEKGTGKTIIAEYISNIQNDVIGSLVVDFSTIDYEYFRRLSDEGFLKFTPLEKVWRVLLLLIVIEKVHMDEAGIDRFTEFKRIRNTIQEFSEAKFKPELLVATELLSKIEGFAQATSQVGVSASVRGQHERRGEAQEIQSHVNRAADNLFAAFKGLNLSKDYIVFVDGIDLKPDAIKFDAFIQLLRAFNSAALYLNEQLFARMKGKGRIKICLLVRPDIFDKLNMQNQSARISDNSVVLNWDTTYAAHRNSPLFFLCDRVLANQNSKSIPLGDGWDTYVNRDVYHKHQSVTFNNSFIEFLRMSWFRPRDIIKTLQMCQLDMPSDRIEVRRSDFEVSYRRFSDYLFGEVRDFSRFYFSDSTFSLIESFFSEVRVFDLMTYDNFRRAHEIFVKKKSSIISEGTDTRLEDVDVFLQILYSSNVICWREENDYGKMEDHWAFRDRTPNQLEPKVALYSTYSVHAGLKRALRMKMGQVANVEDP